ncbi:MAG: type I methionyl aminopeptidase [Candidatus Cloacimonetes bacterium]|nr:type I methionyl aminopeptidase [Candidatus Cloacimonadota bacterium]
MIPIKNDEEVGRIREANRIVAMVLHTLKDEVKAGVSTWELDRIAAEIIRGEGAKPAFLGYQIPGLPPFPAAICASMNDTIVHGIPRKGDVLRDGDIIGVDVGTVKNGCYGDGAWTYVVGGVPDETIRLLEVTLASLLCGIAQAVAGNRVGDISAAIGAHIRKNGYHAADSLTGHGVGFALHEEPMVPNVGRKGLGARLRAGMTLAIEPMVNVGTSRVKEVGWEFKTADGSLSAHFEHSILIRDGEPEILTKTG